MKIIIAGLGPGNPELVTLEALNHARSSDVIIAPRSRKNTPGVAENIIAHHLPDAKIIPVLFPMITDTEQRDKIILEQLTDIQLVNKIFFPVIGDSMLYSTGAYLLDVWRKIIRGICSGCVCSLNGRRVCKKISRNEHRYTLNHSRHC